MQLKENIKEITTNIMCNIQNSLFKLWHISKSPNELSRTQIEIHCENVYWHKYVFILIKTHRGYDYLYHGVIYCRKMTKSVRGRRIPAGLSELGGLGATPVPGISVNPLSTSTQTPTPNFQPSYGRALHSEDLRIHLVGCWLQCMQKTCIFFG